MKYKVGDIIIIKRGRWLAIGEQTYFVTEVEKMRTQRYWGSNFFTFFAKEMNNTNLLRHFESQSILRYANDREKFLYLMHGITVLTEEDINEI